MVLHLSSAHISRHSVTVNILTGPIINNSHHQHEIDYQLTYWQCTLDHPATRVQQITDLYLLNVLQEKVKLSTSADTEDTTEVTVKICEV